jgi:cytoskeleton protein RodZ
MTTRTVGELLKAERTSHHISLGELSKRTRIRREYLEALEQNEFSKLPAATFVKGYIKTYARVFGFDHEPLLALLRRDYKESAKGKLVPREFIKPVLKRGRTFTPVTLFVLGLAAVFLSLVGYVGFQWYNLNKPPELTLAAPEDDAIVASRVVVEGKTVPEAVVTVNSQPVALRPDGSFATEVFVATEGISSITVEATDRRGKTNRLNRTVHVRF